MTRSGVLSERVTRTFAPIICTRADLDENALCWRWYRWCEAWLHIGAYGGDLDRRERALYEDR